ncbi:MAG TPA: DUF4337 family protein [Phycisphaerales bacterium]|nr:DUF4337 family protein [Phycisphaerales bacterium]
MSDTSSHPEKPITEVRIPGTEVPDVQRATAPLETDAEKTKRWMARVAVSTAIMAAIAAISSSLATGHLNKAMFETIQEADQWSFYQAKGIKLALLENRLEAAAAAKQTVPVEETNKLARYEQEQAGIKATAIEHQDLSKNHLKRYGHLSRAATAAQIGIALAATAMLLRRNALWALALAAGAVGAVFLVIGLLG